MGASSHSALEFPCLSSLGIYPKSTTGDGNCLFNALSDQLYGAEDQHAAIRARVIAYMRAHAAYYKQFIDVHPGGGIRRNPKRKNGGAYSSPAGTAAPSDADIDRVFESHLQSMARGGTYGDNMELSAFSSAFDVDVKIYQRDFAYMVSGGGEAGERRVAHVAYHMWEHYSSIRNLAGPHTGLPNVQIKPLSREEEQQQQEKLAQTPHVLPWQVDVVSKSLPYLADKPTIKRVLEQCRGDINRAVDRLLAAEEERGSASSAHESSSVERDHDSDDDDDAAPNKKQDRRLSRAARAPRPKTAHRHLLATLAAHDASQESLVSYASSASSVPDTSQHSHTTTAPADEDDDNDDDNDDDDDEWTPRLHRSHTPSRSAPPAKPPRLKIHPPKPPLPAHTRKTQQRQPGPRPQRSSAAQTKQLAKVAQKAARKQRQLPAAAAAGEEAAGQNVARTLEPYTQPAVVVESGMRTLYI